MKSNTFKKLNGKGLKIAIVQARFNNEITDALAQGAVKALMESGVADKDIKIFQVPGAFEIPLACQRLARPPAGGKKFDGVITIGAIIKGETAHDVYLANTATNGIMRVMLDYNFPIAFGVITTYNLTHLRKKFFSARNAAALDTAFYRPRTF